MTARGDGTGATGGLVAAPPPAPRTASAARSAAGAGAARAFTERTRYHAGDAVTSVALSTDRRRIAAASVDGRLHVLDGDGHLLWRSPSLEGEAWCTAVSADGGRVAVCTSPPASGEGSVAVFDGLGQELFQCAVPASVRAVALSGDGLTLAAAVRPGHVWLFRWTGRSYRRHEEPLALDGEDCVRLALLDGTGQVCAAGSGGAVHVTGGGQAHRRVPLGAGVVDLAADRYGAGAVAACDDGRVRILDLRRGTAETVPGPSEAVCSVATSPDLGVLLLGRADGRVSLTGRQGAVYWRYAVDGEVWSTALSEDAATAVIGSGDGSVTVLDNRLTLSCLAHVRACERAHARGDDRDASALLALYGDLGILVYGHGQLARTAAARSADALAALEAEVVRVLGGYLDACPDQAAERQLLADLLCKAGRHQEAVGHYQRAAADADLTTEALHGAGACFRSLGLEYAARKSQERIHQRRLARGELVSLYELARLYEQRGELVEARSVFETVAAWNAHHRDAVHRALDLARRTAVDERAAHGCQEELSGADEEYPATVVMGPSARTGVAPPPWPGPDGDTLAYRDHLLHGGRIVNKAFGNLPSTPVSRITLAGYLAYDFAPPADEAKKWLDIVHTLAYIEEAGIRGRSLDIGTATGRYPRVLRKLGFNSFGVDMEPEAIRYARSATRYTDESVPLVVGDGAHLPFADGAFDLVTCMMGTFSHMTPTLLPRVLGEVLRVLRPGGHLVCSNWDPGARRMDFLAMYTPAQVDFLRTNLRSRGEFRREVEKAGLDVVRVDPFCIFPSFVGYDVGKKTDHTFELQRLIDLDLAYQTRSGESHGQMFMLAARKPR
ncbi:methyltransferase domain-containing protein [Streptomyces sioyaensis]|uniref:methyltransferase domain-containing protein n=1 Tax=Streptomyces sioyaensis TaxID=67364 RepID=UPI0037A61796